MRKGCQPLWAFPIPFTSWRGKGSTGLSDVLTPAHLAVLKFLLPLPCMRKAWLLQKLLHAVSPLCAEALLVHCAIWTGAHGSQPCHILSTGLSLGRWSDSLSRAPGRSCKQVCSTNPGSAGTQSFVPSELSRVPRAGCPWDGVSVMLHTWLHVSINKTVTFLRDSQRLHSRLWSQVWENLGASKSVSPPFHVLQLNEIQTCAGI